MASISDKAQLHLHASLYNYCTQNEIQFGVDNRKAILKRVELQATEAVAQAVSSIVSVKEHEIGISFTVRLLGHHDEPLLEETHLFAKHLWAGGGITDEIGRAFIAGAEPGYDSDEEVDEVLMRQQLAGISEEQVRRLIQFIDAYYFGPPDEPEPLPEPTAGLLSNFCVFI